MSTRVDRGGRDRSRRWLPDVELDLRYAWRSLRRAPGFTVIAVVTLALGIGANTAMFSVLNTYLFRALPYPNADRLVRVFRTSIHSQSWPHSAANFLDQRSKNTVFEYMVAFNRIRQSLVEEGEAPEGLQGIGVTADFFPALGVAPALGRAFTAEEDQPGANMVVVLSDRFWGRRFGSDPGVLGLTIRLEGESVRVIGVMPPEFEHPLLWGSVDVWRPLAFTPEQRGNRGNNYLAAFARLKPGVSLAQAQDAMVALAADLSNQTSSNQDESLRLEPLQAVASDDIARTVMWFTFGLAAFVLLIGCANLANLELVRTTTRAREHAIRGALGAARGRLIRQSLMESLVIACLGGGLSLLLALASVHYISLQLFVDLPGAQVTLDPRVFGFTLLCSVLTAFIFGTVPAWLASRADVNHALKEEARGSTSRSQQRVRHALIVGEVAFALVLLTGAGLFLRGLHRFSQRDPGWRVDGLLMAQLGVRGANYTTPSQRATFYHRLEERLRALPGVQEVALSSSQPIYSFNSSGGFVIEGQPEPQPGHYPEVFSEPVSVRYFDTYGIRLLEGRTFNTDDTVDRTSVVIINRTMARRFWPAESAIGKRIGRPGPNRNWVEVVGVVDDVAFPANLSEPYTRLESYRPLAQQTPPAVSVTLRSNSPEALADVMRKAVAELDPSLPLVRIRTARALVDQGLGNVSLLGTLLGAFALLGLTLAAIGVYAVTSYSVVQRAGELGIRMALGAQARDVLWLVLSRGTRLIAMGAALGIGGAYAVARVLASAIPTLPTRDPAAWIALTITLVAVALLACYVPARRATKVPPASALRHS